MELLCRICLTENDVIKYYNLFNSNLQENNSNLATCIMECVPVYISLNDGLPDKICSNCYDQLILVKNFRIKCLTSDSVLRKKLKSTVKPCEPTSNERVKLKKSCKMEFNCPFCENIFISKLNLYKHLCLVHKINKIYKKHKSTVDPRQQLRLGLNLHKVSTSQIKINDKLLKHFVKINNRYNSTNSSKLNKRKLFNCKICKKVFNRRSLILSYLRVHSSKRPFFCKICKSRFKFNSNLRNHMINIHKVDKNFQYKVCTKRFNKAGEELSDHQNEQQITKINHNDSQNENYTNSESETEIFDSKNKKLFACKICKKIFKRKYLLNAHTRVHSGERPFLCKICKKTFKYNSNLRHHMVDIHGVKKNTRKNTNSEQDPNESISKTEFSCETCKKIFKKKSLLNAHLRTHTGERPFICDICGKTFAFMGPLKIHLRIHAGDKRYKCEQCGKTCTTGSELSIHMKMHSDKLPYKCDICGKAFKWNSNCLKHKRKHSGIRAYQCNFCNKSFLELGTLKTHTRLHLGTLPYKCEICEKKFNISYNLKKHMQTHL